MTYFVTCSGGNDSIALVQFMLEYGEPFHVVYNNTGWAHKDWAERMTRVRGWVEKEGMTFHETKSEGMKNLIRRKGCFPKPASNMQFCTSYLKEKPSLDLYDRIDPDCDFVVVTGRRREESQNRRDLPVYGTISERHGGRDVWNPLYRHTEEMRDTLLSKTPFERIETQSLECYPCINANKYGGVLPNLDPDRVDEIESFELSLGLNGKGNPRTMFRPSRTGGSVGIRQVLEWANGQRGWKSLHYPEAYKNLPHKTAKESVEEEVENSTSGSSCDAGYCGS